MSWLDEQESLLLAEGWEKAGSLRWRKGNLVAELFPRLRKQNFRRLLREQPPFFPRGSVSVEWTEEPMGLVHLNDQRAWLAEGHSYLEAKQNVVNLLCAPLDTLRTLFGSGGN